jgi:hydrogenase 3 maturation protease
MDLDKILDDLLPATGKVAVICAGSELMSDDIAGILVVDHLNGKLKGKSNLKILNGSNAPENFTGEIKNFDPGVLVIIDAADMKEKPGSIMVIDPNVIEGVSFSTHMLPLKVMINYLKKEINCRILILGIQPINVEFGNKVSPEVLEAVDELKIILEKKLEKFD